MRSSILLLVIYLCGCQTVLRSGDTVSCSSERGPASAIRCEGLFSERQVLSSPTRQELQGFLKDLADYGAPYSDISKAALTNYLPYPGSLLQSLGQHLLTRKNRGDFTAKTLVELGYREYDGNLIPPQNLDVLYASLYTKLINAANAAGVKSEEIIFPAFLFRKTAHNGTKQSLFVRPGIDPLPPKNEGWTVETKDTLLSAEEFTNMILDRKMLVPPGFIYHDINHIIDFIERPHYMATFRYFLLAKDKFNKLQISPGEKNKLYGNIEHILESDNVTNEFMTYANAGNRSQFSKILLSPDKLETPEATLARYETMDFESALKKAHEFMDKQDVLFSRHGGAIREQFTEFNEKVELVGRMAVDVYEGKKASSISKGDELYQSYLANESTGMFQVLNTMVKFLENPNSVMFNVTKRLRLLAKQDSIDIQTVAKIILIKQLAEIDQRVRTGLHYQISPERIVYDVSLMMQPNGWKQYMQTATYAYYSTFRTGSYQRNVFGNVEPQ
jgi:hypothetical protein